MFHQLVLAQSVVGLWKTIDDETKKPKSVLEIKEVNGALEGVIHQIFKEKSETLKCDKCPDEFKDKPLLGLKIMWGLKKKSPEEWVDGKIMDPNNGKIYSCKLKISESGKELEVRGYLGFSLLGRTQTWIKESP